MIVKKRIVLIVLINTAPGFLVAKGGGLLDSLQTSYKRIGDNLVDIRKKYPDMQTKVYTILDQIDKLYKTARESIDVVHTLQKKVKDKEVEVQEVMKSKDLEATGLQHEVAALKSVLDTTQHKLEVATQKLEHEKQCTSKLTKEITLLTQHQAKKELSDQEKVDKALAKVAEVGNQHNREEEKVIAKNAHQKGNDQNLSLNSTSAPSSPR